MKIKKVVKRFFPVYNWVRTTIRLKKKIKGNNNTIKIKGVIASKSLIEITGNSNQVFIDGNSKIHNMRIRIEGNNNIVSISENCKLYGDWWCIWGNNCQILMGDHCTTEGVHIAALEDNSKVSFGKDCMMSGQIEMRTSDSHSVIDLATNKRTNFAKDISIGNHVWICSKATILKGVMIIIATGSVVTKSIPEGCIASGNPARIVKTNITWDRDINHK